MEVFPWESEISYKTSVYSVWSHQLSAKPWCKRPFSLSQPGWKGGSCDPFSAPRPSHRTGTAEGTGVRILSPVLLKGFLLHDREGPKIWCLLRSTFHKIKSEDSVLQILNKIIFLKWRNIDWFSPWDRQLSTTQKIWGSQVIIPQNAGVLFVCVFFLYRNILMAENISIHLPSKDKMEKTKMLAMMIIQTGINIFVNYLWYCVSSFLCSRAH